MFEGHAQQQPCRLQGYVHERAEYAEDYKKEFQRGIITAQCEQLTEAFKHSLIEAVPNMPNARDVMGYLGLIMMQVSAFISVAGKVNDTKSVFQVFVANLVKLMLPAPAELFISHKFGTDDSGDGKTVYAKFTYVINEDEIKTMLRAVEQSMGMTMSGEDKAQWN